MYIMPTTTAKLIRKALKKELGYTNRLIKVTTKGWAVSVIARTDEVDLKKVFAIASQFKTDNNYIFVGEIYTDGFTRHIPSCELH